MSKSEVSSHHSMDVESSIVCSKPQRTRPKCEEGIVLTLCKRRHAYLPATERNKQMD
jgi:hypothetical protein